MQSAILEDFIDEEVVDRRGNNIGVLSCYWESAPGHVFLGIKPQGLEEIRVVPAEGVKLDEHHSCVLVPFAPHKIRTAPVYDCDKELRSQLEEAASRHFGVETTHRV